MKTIGVVVFSFVDFFFNTERIWTIIASAIIGMLSYQLIYNSFDESQPRYYWIIIGLPIWLIIRYLYWKIRLSMLPNIEIRWSYHKIKGFYW